jgi:hypothetical protein
MFGHTVVILKDGYSFLRLRSSIDYFATGKYVDEREMLSWDNYEAKYIKVSIYGY